MWFLPGREGSSPSPFALKRILAAERRQPGQVKSCQATRPREDRWLAVALERTFDITVQLSLRMEILKPFEELTDDDGNVLFSEDAGLHLRVSTPLAPGKSKLEPGGRRAVWTDQIGA